MSEIFYGKARIAFTYKVNNSLKHGYISVDKDEGVILKAPQMEEGDATKLIYRKAPWILEKFKCIRQERPKEPTTGSRLPYLGKSYYVQIIPATVTKVVFTYSSFKIYGDSGIQNALEAFYKDKARKKLLPRIDYWITITGLTPSNIMLRRLKKRWGSCTKKDAIILNYNIVKLSASLQDYVIVHELCHIKFKKHSPLFWAEVGKYLPQHRTMEGKLLRIP